MPHSPRPILRATQTRPFYISSRYQLRLPSSSRYTPSFQTGHNQLCQIHRLLSTISAPTKDTWSPSQYEKFSEQRSLPIRDLINAVKPHLTTTTPTIYDLGCGSATSTSMLASAFPDARIIGVDSSEAMLSEARKRMPGTDFQDCDIQDWSVDPDVISRVKESKGQIMLFSNSTFHWLPQRTRIPTLTRLLDPLPPGSILALQFPSTHRSPTHIQMRKTASVRNAPWSKYFGKGRFPDFDRAESAARYYSSLGGLCEKMEVWKTEYMHVVPDTQAIVEWVKGTGLRPFLDWIEGPNERAAFLKEYERWVAKEYGGPENRVVVEGRTEGVVLGYRRQFVLGVRK
ncbi:S-adenosyl-L-methionine-dependent methyltransferase [Sporormia fimetaria CBS 119925]|uniref:S-adenosyl-L-methionine-dependent methyltransferase n=1 Tax=Sporormia fimetaria CBS 119925 TaxID=1340428 RepID=A0A6A6VMZ3_9PLEO|nr:S-adenosyl-L-methionine-dependent methyltransferase [Sporormia fimetaria CBS 119925]